MNALARPIVVALGDASATEEVGGKGANLGAMLRARFPVPDGFVVTTNAFDRVLPVNLAELVRRSTDGAAVHERVSTVDMPPEVVAAIAAAYRDMGGGPVAVRSSATAEDLPEATFAGQQDTFLNVIGDDALLAAVRRCWASLWSARAVAYRRRRGVEGASMAVVVQRMVPAEFAGVMFTANPVTGARDEVVIDASEGLGEAVVSGIVTPDHYVVRKRRVVTAQRGRGEIAVRPLPGGGTETVAANADDELPETVLKKLSRQGKQIERYFGAPQDIEWAWADGRLSIVQARPITALPPPPPKRRTPSIRPFTMSEAFPIRPYPFDISTWTGAMFRAAYDEMSVGGKMPPWDTVFIEQDGVVVRCNLPAPTPSLKGLAALVQIMVDAVRYDPREIFADPVLAGLVERMRALGQQDVTQLEWNGLHDVVREAMSAPSQIWELRRHYLPRTFFGIGYVLVLLRVLGLHDRLTDLFTTSDSITSKINAEIGALAAEIRADPELREQFANHEPSELLDVISSHPFMDKLTEFLNQYGNRETVSLVLASQPTWSTEPAVVVGMLKSVAASSPASRDEPVATQLRRQLLRTGPRRWSTRALDLIGAWVRLMEGTHFYLTLSLPPIYNAMVEFGRRLVADDLLDDAEDVVHLRLDEIQREPGRREIVARRKATRAALAGTPYLESEAADTTDVPDEALVRGMPGSPGAATGPVRIIRDPAEFSKLQRGDVLVAPYTNPAWTPIFQQAAAVVVDTGGSAAHAAIVAREYGIPAVMGTGDATTVLTDGQTVRVYGDRGIVLRAD